MWVQLFIYSLPENKMRLVHSFLRISHKISGGLFERKVPYFFAWHSILLGIMGGIALLWMITTIVNVTTFLITF